jgi:chaperone BCS1
MSLTFALAARLNLHVYVITVAGPGITDSILPWFLRTLPAPSILLIEDIDSAGLVPDKEGRKDDARNEEGQLEGRLTRTGFINAIDGIASQEGYILVITTNFLKKLDSAMTRPG